jgi:hypothetical protein
LLGLGEDGKIILNFALIKYSLKSRTKFAVSVKKRQDFLGRLNDCYLLKEKSVPQRWSCCNHKEPLTILFGLFTVYNILLYRHRSRAVNAAEYSRSNSLVVLLHSRRKAAEKELILKETALNVRVLLSSVRSAARH